MPELSFTLNGTPTTALYQEGMTLLEVLRDVLGVVSPKDGCSPQGACGCCTVLVGSRAVLSCLRKPDSVEGMGVTTLEGLAAGKRQILAQAFVNEGGLQCGYCTPGILARAAALLDRNPSVDEAEIRKALSGHLCRCTGYQRIVDAILSAGEVWQTGGPLEAGKPRRAEFFSKGEGRALAQPPKTTGVGSLSPRYRGLDHALGQKDYIADMTVEAMLHGAMVLSRYPRARVLELDPSEILQKPGVVRVLTAADVPGHRHVGLIRADWPVFVEVGETTRCVGDVLALVVAESRFLANEAARRLEETVEYEVLDPVTDPEHALEAGAPQLHEGGNLLDVCAFSRGDVDAALEAATHVVEETFSTQRIEHAFLEPEACLAVPASSGLATPLGPSGSGRLKVFTQGQGVHEDKRQIASVLGLAPEAVEVELVSNGGAFGGKEDLSVQAQTALAAFLTHRPVRTVLTRD